MYKNKYVNILDKDVENIVPIQLTELQKLKDRECSLKCENQRFKTDLQCHISKIDDLTKQLEHAKQKESEYQELLSKLEDGEKEVIMFKFSFFTRS